MAKQDEYVRITLRLPPELHTFLVKETRAKSLNATIVSILEDRMYFVEGMDPHNGNAEDPINDKMIAEILEENSKTIAKILKAHGVDYVDLSEAAANTTEEKSASGPRRK